MTRAFLFLFAFLVCSAVQASEATVKEALQKKYPDLGDISKVVRSDVLGLYEVVMDGRLFYTDEDTKYLFNGNIFDLAGKRNLTEERARILLAVDFDSLPLNLAVKKVKGDGKRRMAYFADPNCGFCKKLETELEHVDNVTLYRFLYPIFPGSDEKVRNILCNADPNKSWENWMTRGVQPDSAKCDAADLTDDVVALGRKLNVTGTPTLIFASGLLNPGYMPAEDLEKALDAPRIVDDK